MTSGFLSKYNSEASLRNIRIENMLEALWIMFVSSDNLYLRFMLVTCFQLPCVSSIYHGAVPTCRYTSWHSKLLPLPSRSASCLPVITRCVYFRAHSAYALNNLVTSLPSFPLCMKVVLTPTYNSVYYTDGKRREISSLATVSTDILQPIHYYILQSLRGINSVDMQNPHVIFFSKGKYCLQLKYITPSAV